MSHESKQKDINWRSYFWKESHPMDLECMSGDTGGAHEGGGRALLPRGFLAASLTSTPSLLDCVCSKNDPREGFITFGLRLIFLFCETLK